MIIILGSEFFTLLGFLLLGMLAIGGAVAEWIARYSIGVCIVVLLCWITYTYSTVTSLRGRAEGPKFSLAVGLLHAVPQIAVIATGYYYFIGQIDKNGAVSGVVDILVCLGVYAAANMAWNKLVVQDKVSKWAAVLLSIAHLGISIFFIIAFMIVQ